MLDDGVAFHGLNRLENELLVRDFLEVLSTGDCTAIMPFIHRDIQFAWAPGSRANGSRGVRRVWEELVAHCGIPSVRIITIASVDETVIVEASLSWHDNRDDRNGSRVFAAFEICDYQIVQWRQANQ